MKYFIDTEFLEGAQKKLFGETKPTIDLISIALVAEDNREYYAISKDFNLKEAWNRYDIKKEWYSIDESTQSTRNVKVYWLRDNVLKPIYEELISKEFEIDILAYNEYPFKYSSMKYLINKYGKTNKQIAEEIINFCAVKKSIFETDGLGQSVKARLEDSPINFYGYYSDYDWVVFCWLFGKMIDLPNGFPMYCIDLKQTLDEKAYEENKLHQNNYVLDFYTGKTKDDMIEFWKKHNPNYPKQTNEHNALADARFNRDLYNFLNTI